MRHDHRSQAISRRCHTFEYREKEQKIGKSMAAPPSRFKTGPNTELLAARPKYRGIRTAVTRAFRLVSMLNRAHGKGRPRRPGRPVHRCAITAPLLQKQHFVNLREVLCLSDFLNLVEVHTTRNASSDRVHAISAKCVEAGDLVFVYKSHDFLTQNVVNHEADLRGLWNSIPNRRFGVERIREVVIQGEVLRDQCEPVT